jgi:hypothetical protein
MRANPLPRRRQLREHGLITSGCAAAKLLDARVVVECPAYLADRGTRSNRRTSRITAAATSACRPPAASMPGSAIHAIEEAPPHGTEPLEWMLLSSVPTTSLDEVLERLAWYARRWTIESWHRVLKSGCRIEARQFGSLERFVRATALFAVISWRILYATLLARIDTDLSCEVLLQPVEWQALYCHTHHTRHPPKKTPPLQQAVLWIAMLGGYLNRRHDRPPGPTVIWRWVPYIARDHEDVSALQAKRIA